MTDSSVCHSSLSGDLDSFIRRRRRILIGERHVASAPEINAALTRLSGEAATLWDSMTRHTAFAGMWSDLPLAGVSDADISANMGATFDRLFAMSVAYATPRSKLHQNAALGIDLVGAIEAMVRDFFMVDRAPVGNWWFWEIGVPGRATDISVLLHDIMPADLRKSLMEAVRYYAPDPNYRGRGRNITETGANRTDKALSCALRGVLDNRPEEIALARDALSDVADGGRNSVFNIVNHGDGFYADGSFVQHERLPYAGTYGVVALRGVAEMVSLLADSKWEVPVTEMSTILESVENTFAPFIWNGRMMDTVRGRAVSRFEYTDHVHGASAISAILILAEGCGEPYRTRYRSLAKGWLQRSSEAMHELRHQSLADSWRMISVSNDVSVVPATAPVFTRAFGDQDRLVHHRPSFSTVVSISSSRIGRYEAGNRENNQGWYQGDGMMFVYTAGSPDHYSADFWPTIDPYRLPGTTVTSEPRESTVVEGTFVPAGYRPFAGGLALNGRWGMQGMDHLNFNRTLSARKSWFFIDDRIVCLGAGITSESDFDVFTTVDNRSYAHGAVPRIHIDGRKLAAHASSQPLRITRHAHIAGYGGYVFLSGENVTGTVDFQVIHRQGTWHNINSGAYTGGDDRVRARDFVTLTHNHGVRPRDGGYAYLLMPNATHSATVAESAAPTIEVVANSTMAQAVRAPHIGLTMANFFTAGATSGLQTDGPCSVGVLTVGGQVTVALSDPSRTKSLVRVSLQDIPTVAVIASDDGVRLTSTSPPTLEFELDNHGHAKQIALRSLAVERQER